MKVYETSATVEAQGRLIVGGVPFPPGTEVAVMISPTQRHNSEVAPPEEEALAAARERLRELFRTVRGFRNSPHIAREELYERGHFH